MYKWLCECLGERPSLEHVTEACTATDANFLLDFGSHFSGVRAAVSGHLLVS